MKSFFLYLILLASISKVNCYDRAEFGEEDIDDSFAIAYEAFVAAKSGDFPSRENYYKSSGKLFLKTYEQASDPMLRKRALWYLVLCELFLGENILEAIPDDILSERSKNSNEEGTQSILEMLKEINSLRVLYAEYCENVKIRSYSHLSHPFFLQDVLKKKILFLLGNYHECALSRELINSKIKQVLCCERLRMLGVILYLYAEENKESFPPHNYDCRDKRVSRPFYLELEEFFKRKKNKDIDKIITNIFKCPEVKDGYINYGMNMQMESLYSGNPARLKYPSKMCLLADSVHYLKNSYPGNPLYRGGSYRIWSRIEHNGIGTIDWNRHDNGANILFVDGHVEWIAIDNVAADLFSFWFGE